MNLLPHAAAEHRSQDKWYIITGGIVAAGGRGTLTPEMVAAVRRLPANRRAPIALMALQQKEKP